MISVDNVNVARRGVRLLLSDSISQSNYLKPELFMLFLMLLLLVGCVRVWGHLCEAQQKSDASIPGIELSLRHRSQRSSEFYQVNITDQL